MSFWNGNIIWKCFSSIRKWIRLAHSPDPPKKTYYTLTHKQIFQLKTIFMLASKNQFCTTRKNFLYLPEKITNFLPWEQFLIIIGKNNFPNKKFLILALKNKVLHLRCVLDKAVLFFILGNISQSLFEKHFYFSIFHSIFVLYPTSFCLTSSGRFLYCSWPYCHLFFDEFLNILI